jgi:hypothetical protein
MFTFFLGQILKSRDLDQCYINFLKKLMYCLTNGYTTLHFANHVWEFQFLHVTDKT